MKDNVYGRYALDLKWKEMLEKSQLEEGDDWFVRNEGDKIYLHVPTNLKKLEKFIEQLFSIDEATDQF